MFFGHLNSLEIDGDRVSANSLIFGTSAAPPFGGGARPARNQHTCGVSILSYPDGTACPAEALVAVEVSEPVSRHSQLGKVLGAEGICRHASRADAGPRSERQPSSLNPIQISGFSGGLTVMLAARISHVHGYVAGVQCHTLTGRSACAPG